MSGGEAGAQRQAGPAHFEICSVRDDVHWRLLSRNNRVGGQSRTGFADAAACRLGLKPSKKPSLSGKHRVGKVESVKAGTWPRGVKFTYQWLLNGKVIKHATKSSLKLPKSDKGKKISCRVTAHLAGFANGVATTAGVKVTG